MLVGANICKEGGRGLVLPLISTEHEWPDVLRAFLYGLGLCYFFMGVAIIADVFMASIEKVTSVRVSRVQKDGRRRTSMLWNETVATLSLMALGSSAPEIFLSVIDMIKGKFHFSSDLGASTIVGSAAFNLFVIIAVCVFAIPTGEVRMIKNLPAFYITAVFSMIAYLWMAFILLYSSPNVVLIWEGLTTFFLLPVLIYVSYRVDRGDADGVLRKLRIITAEDEIMAALPSRRPSENHPANHPAKRKSGPTSQISLQSLSKDHTVVWYSRNGGWQAVPHSLAEEAEQTYSRIPMADSRVIFDPQGIPVKSWFASQAHRNALNNYFAQLLSGSYLKFAVQTIVKHPASLQDSTLQVVVRRTGRCDSVASCAFRTESISAATSLDYQAVEGRLDFEAGEEEKVIEIPICARTEWRKEVKLLVLLEDEEGDIKFDPLDDGGTISAILTVFLEGFPVTESSSNRVRTLRALDQVLNVRMMHLGCIDWYEQLGAVRYVNGDEEEQSEASKLDWFFHIACFPWRLVSALLPPTTFFGGWLAFVASLTYLAVTTAIVSDLAELFGCVLGIPSIVTAITLVALGTSMPDLFASLSAAKEDPTADASVVNVAGSNSVNVFLGLGVPWSLAAIYWESLGRTPEWERLYPDVAAEIKGCAFVVESANLGHSVLIFCATCSVALALLHVRRRWVGAELGGSLRAKVATSAVFTFLWVLFASLVSWRVLRWGKPDYTNFESVCIHAAALVFTLIFVGVALRILWLDRNESAQRAVEEEASAEKQRVAEESASFEQKSALKFEKDLADDWSCMTYDAHPRCPNISVPPKLHGRE